MAREVQIQLSSSGRAKRLRIQRLPKQLELMADTFTLRDANELIKIFQEGIRDGTFDLEPLAPGTVASKRRAGLQRPRTPLYGQGDDQKRSLLNALLIRRTKNGYRVAPRAARHHTAALRLKQLLDIHENGAVIRHGDRVIRIPPRPAFTMAFRRLLIRLRRRDPAPEVVRALTSLVNDASDKLVRRLSDVSESDRAHFA